MHGGDFNAETRRMGGESRVVNNLAAPPLRPTATLPICAHDSLAPSPQCNLGKSFIFSKILGCHFGELINVGGAGCLKSGEDGAAFVGDDIAMGLWDFADEAMGTEQTQLTGDGASLGVLGPERAQGFSQIAIAKSVKDEPAISDGLEKDAVFGRPWA